MSEKPKMFQKPKLGISFNREEIELAEAELKAEKIKEVQEKAAKKLQAKIEEEYLNARTSPSHFGNQFVNAQPTTNTTDKPRVRFR